MRINGYKKYNNYNNKCNNNKYNKNIYCKKPYCNFNNNCCINSLFEVENFLCNFNKILNCINLYKNFK